MSIFTRFLPTDIVTANATQVTTGLWSGNTASLGSGSMFTGSQGASGSISAGYYTNIYNANPSASSLAAVQFAVAYGHVLGGGATLLANDPNSTAATQGTYLQYRNILLEPGDPTFTFFGGYNSDDIYVINIQRANLKEMLDPGNWQLTLSGSSGSFTFIDDSGQTLGTAFGQTGAVYNFVSGALSGSNGYTIYSTGSNAFGGFGFGLVYPSVGLFVLNPAAIKATVGFLSGSYYISGTKPFAANTGTVELEYNQVGLVNSMILGGNFQARSAENISSTHYFVRLQNSKFNYSNNPSFFNETNGVINNTAFVNDPRVYPTTIGLYNDNNDLLAVGKLSKPVQKAFDKELLIRVRLDF